MNIIKLLKEQLKITKQLIEAIFAYLIYYILRCVPIKISSTIGYTIGYYIMSLLPFRRKYEVLHNIQLAFPDKSLSFTNSIYRQSCGNFIKLIFELPRLLDLSKNIRIIDPHNMVNFLKNNTALVFTAHIGLWELFGYPFYQYNYNYAIYKTPSNPYLQNLFIQIRKHHSKFYNYEMISLNKSTMLQLNSALKNELISITMLIDQRIKEGVKAKLFNRVALTSAFLPTLSLKHNIPLIPIRVIRQNNSEIHIILDKPLEILNKSENRQTNILALTQLMNDSLESWIKETPGQWFWLHRRW